MISVSEQDNVVVKRSLAVVAAALGMGLAFDILFFDKLPGISFPLYVVLTVAALMFAGLRQRKTVPKSALYMIPPILFFSSMVYVRAGEFLTFINVVVTLYLLGLFVTLVLRPGLRNYSTGSYLSLMIKLPLRVMGKAAEALKTSMARRGFISKHKELSHVIRGVVIALPVLLLFVALFSSADLVFRGYVDDLFNFNISSDLFWQTFWLLAVAGVFAGLFGMLSERPGPGDQVTAAAKTGKGKFGLVETSILLGSLNALFFCFIFVQLAYLFGGSANVVGGEFTYAEYARKGFFELVAVAGLSLLLLFVTERLMLREREKHDGKFKLLSGLLIAQVLIIMVSAFKRLQLYEAAYGFTSLRLYGFIFIIWLAVVFAVLLYKIFANRRENELALAMFVSVLALFATFNFINIDGMVARRNIDRYEKTGKLDIRYLGTLSDDAVTEVAGLLNSKDAELRDGLAISLYERRQVLQAAAQEGWQSSNVTRSSALRALNEHSALLEQSKHKVIDPAYTGPGQ